MQIIIDRSLHSHLANRYATSQRYKNHISVHKYTEDKAYLSRSQAFENNGCAAVPTLTKHPQGRKYTSSCKNILTLPIQYWRNTLS